MENDKQKQTLKYIAASAFLLFSWVALGYSIYNFNPHYSTTPIVAKIDTAAQERALQQKRVEISEQPRPTNLSESELAKQKKLQAASMKASPTHLTPEEKARQEAITNALIK